MDYRLPVAIMAGHMSPYACSAIHWGLEIPDTNASEILVHAHKGTFRHEIHCHVTKSMLLPQHLLPIPMFSFVTPAHYPLI